MPDVHGGGSEVWRKAGTRARVSAVLGVIVLAVLAVGAVAMLRHAWFPTGDFALAQMRLEQASVHFPTVGVYSRFGWFHPGPAYLLWQWLPYQLLGPRGQIAGMLAWHLGAVALAWWSARRVDPAAGAWVLLGGVLLLAATGADTLSAPWNPYVGLVGAMLVLVCAWAAAQRSAWGTAALLPVGSMLVQSHVGTAPLVALASLAGVALAFRRRGSGSAAAVPWVAWATGVTVAAIMWLPPLWQQLTGQPANLTALLGNQTDEGARVGLGKAVGAMTHLFALPPDWTNPTAVMATAPVIPWLLILPVAALALAVRRRDAVALRALAVCGTGLAAALVAVASVSGPLFAYVVAWLPAVAVTTLSFSCWIVVAAAVSSRADGEEQRESAPAPPAAAAATATVAVGVTGAALVIAAVVAVSLVRTTPRDTQWGVATAALGRAAATDAQGDPFRILPRGAAGTLDAYDAYLAYPGVPAEALRLGNDVASTSDLSWATHGALAGEESDRLTYWVRPYRPWTPAAPDERVVSVYDPFSAEEWQQIRQIEECAAEPRPPSCGADAGQAASIAQVTKGRIALALVASKG
ncbi:MAG: hypothetical protein E6Q90_05785 [Actinobacteria bacterium]|nr:MAG: hypothetical protein E6Q90_05785 [Actinomycetota bacterium]